MTERRGSNITSILNRTKNISNFKLAGELKSSFYL